MNRVVIYKQQILLNICLDDKVVGRKYLGKTERITGLLSAALKVMSYSL